jgi:two-component system chemotaxis sensor kinase CheA
MVVNLADLESVAQIGSALEEALGSVPPDAAPMAAALQAALEALQGIYVGQAPDNAATLRAITEAVAAAAEDSSLAGGAIDVDRLVLVRANVVRSLQQAPPAPAAATAKAEASTAATAAKSAETAKSGGGPAEHAQPEHATLATGAAPETASVAATPSPAAPAAARKSMFAGPAILPADTDGDILKEYIVESLDHVGAAEAALLALETDPKQSEPVHTVFRAFHTIKGTSGFLGLDRIQRLAHLAESLLDRVRTNEIVLSGGYADLALESCDVLKAMIQGLTGLAVGSPLPVPETLEDLLARLTEPEKLGITAESTMTTRPDVRLGDILVAEGKATRGAIDAAMAGAPQGAKLGETLVQAGDASAPDVAKALRLQQKIRGDDSDASVRVATGRLDTLINMVGELVISHSMVAHDPDVLSGGGARLARNVARSGKIVRELQDLTMALRMVPLKATFQKMSRVIRDLAHKSGKSVRFVTEGEDTEIDRNMVESIGDPLVHMVRNAVDHGIESPEVRAAAGKPDVGTVTLRAYHSAGNVVIEMVDDGKGLDRQRILAKALERKLVEPGVELTEAQVFALVFLPGFSTAEKVTDVSGRGVGMDVVRKRVESMHGRIDISSLPGKGSTFTVTLPLTMAITDAMLIRVGRERYLLPTVSIVQSFRPEAMSLSTVTGRGEMVMLRGQMVPVIRLHRLFSVKGAVTVATEGLLIVIEATGRRCALLVDELLGQQQVVIKSIGSSLGAVPGIAGGAILGDGRVGLILDSGGIAKLAADGNAELGPRNSELQKGTAECAVQPSHA